MTNNNQLKGLETERWRNCAICKQIPAVSNEFWKGGQLEGNTIPVESLKLEIIGAPFYDDSTSSSNRCWKKCPLCGTVYRWETEYEYLVNGSEDDITLTRLNDEDGSLAVKRAFEAIESAKKEFKNTSVKMIQVLDIISNWNKIPTITTHFSYGQLKGFDISFAIPSLINALARHPHASSECIGRWICWLLRDIAEKSEKNRLSLLEELQKVDCDVPELAYLLNKFRISE